MKPLFLRACNRETVERTPVWYMRQAGRSFPEYRKLKEKYSILTLARTPELAAEVALMPIAQLGVDAAILFADIVLPLFGMGVDLDIVEGVGPVIERPVRTKSAIAGLETLTTLSDFAYLQQSIGLINQGLPETVPLIGFSGAPFTLASYLIEGRPSRDFIETRKMMTETPELWHLLMDKLSDSIIFYMTLQVGAGVKALQLFDSWAGYITREEYETYVLPYSQKIFKALAPLKVPRIHFGTNTAPFLASFASVEAEVIGVDWRISLKEAGDIVGPTKALQGNLNPELLLGDFEEVKKAVDTIFENIGGREGFIFNLGHGVLPETKVADLKKLTDYVHQK